MKLYMVKSIYDYINTVSKIGESSNLWYRGQSKACYRLVPGILRNAVITADWAGRKFEPKKANFSSNGSEEVRYPNFWDMLNQYKMEVTKRTNMQLDNDLDWLCLAQHYGLPTPLIDWSTDPLVALFFAIESISEYNKDNVMLCNNEDYEMSDNCAAVFVIDPIIINTSIKDNYVKTKILDISNDYNQIIKIMESNIFPPICIYGKKYDRRMCRQSGNFTVQSRLTWPLDFFDYFRKNMIKIIIPYSAVPELRQVLKSLYLTKESIYLGSDEKDEIAKEIAKYYNNQFMEQYKSVFASK